MFINNYEAAGSSTRSHIYQQCPQDITGLKDPNGTYTSSYTHLSGQVENTVHDVNRKIPRNLRVSLLDRNQDEIKWCVPWFVGIVCLLQIAIYLANNQWIYQHFLFIPEYRSEWWRFITYTLLQSDIINLSMNVCLQLLVGILLDCEQGHWKVAIIYIAGGVSGSLAISLFDPTTSLLGASAAVYSMMMSHIPHLTKNYSQLPYCRLRIVALVILCLSDAVFMTYHFIVNGNLNPRICLEAHIGGGVVGFMAGFLLYSKHKSPHPSSIQNNCDISRCGCV